MPIRTELAALVDKLRHARTRLLPMEMAERVQHAIVKLEELLAADVPDAIAVEATRREAQQLLDECAAGRP